MNPSSSFRFDHFPAAFLVAAFAMLALGAPLFAQTYTWDSEAGTNNATRSWGNATNWVDDPSPLTFTNTTDIIFAQASITNNGAFSFLGADRTIRSLTFGADLVGGLPANNLYDIRLLETSSSSSTARNLIFSADSGNASITVAQSTSGVSQIRLGNGTGGSIVLNSNLDLAQNNTFLTNIGAFQLGNVVTGTGTINKTGAGAISLVRNNSGWSGGMNINEGAVRIYNDSNAMGTGTWTLGGGTNNTTLTVLSGQTFNNSGGLVVEVGGGTRTIANSDLIVGNPTLTGAITLNKDVIFDIAAYGNNHNTITVAGAIGGTGGIIKTGTGLLTLSGANTYAGDTLLEGGNIQTTAANTLPGTGVLRFGATANDRRLQLQGFNQTLGGVDSTAATGGVLSVEAAVDNTSNAPATLTLDVAAGQSYDFSGLVRNAAGGAVNSALTLVKNGAGTQVLSGGANVSYSGTTTVNAGVLEFGGVDTVADNSAITLAGGAVRFSGGGTRSNTMSGSSGTLEKTGANTLTLSGNNTFSGAASVQAGVLDLNTAGGAAAGSVSSFSVATNAILLLSQSGQVNDTATVSLSGGTIQRGSGVSEVFGSLTLTTGSFLDFGTGDAGNLTFGTYQNNETPSALLTLNNFLPGNSFTFSSTSFSTNSVGSYFTFGTGYVGSSISGTGSTFTITAIPEPSTYLAAAGLLAFLLAARRRSPRAPRADSCSSCSNN